MSSASFSVVRGGWSELDATWRSTRCTPDQRQFRKCAVRHQEDLDRLFPVPVSALVLETTVEVLHPLAQPQSQPSNKKRNDLLFQPSPPSLSHSLCASCSCLSQLQLASSTTKLDCCCPDCLESPSCIP